MKFCPYCGSTLPEGAIYCPYCGKKIEEPKVRVLKEKTVEATVLERKHAGAAIFFVIALMIGLIIVAALLKSPKERVTGKYLGLNYPEVQLSLYKDGTFVLNDSGYITTGTWKLIDNTIIELTVNEEWIRLRIEDNKLVVITGESTGFIFIKQ